MRLSNLLVVLAFVALASSHALSLASDTQELRASVGSSAVGEERGIITALGTRLKRETRKFKGWVIWMFMKRGQNPVPDKRIARVQWWIKRKTPNEILYKHKVSPDEYFQALKLDPKLKMYAHVADAREKNPNLEKFLDYKGYFDYMKAVD